MEYKQAKKIPSVLNPGEDAWSGRTYLVTHKDKISISLLQSQPFYLFYIAYKNYIHVKIMFQLL